MPNGRLHPLPYKHSYLFGYVITHEEWGTSKEKDGQMLVHANSEEEAEARLETYLRACHGSNIEVEIHSRTLD